MSDAEKVVAELRELGDKLPPVDLHRLLIAITKAADLIVHQAAELAWEKSESARRLTCMDRRADRLIELTETIAAKDRELTEAKAAYDGALSTWAESRERHLSAEAALTAAEAEKERLARESISLSALIDLTKGCQHDGGFDREIGPIGCSLGDGCVCCGIVMGARAALSEKEQGA